ncbi:MAG: hypothetical protein M3R15_05465 [Acidobacteriota bacterium]|nr:hypothetical protein [Acidobacteriota bacterium]
MSGRKEHACGCDEHAAARSERATSEASRTRGVLSLDDESSVDVSQADATINISRGKSQHVPSGFFFRF